jgi:hypothetical protein
MEYSRDPVVAPFNRNHPTEYRVFLANFFFACLSASLRRYNFPTMPKQLAVEQLAIADWVQGLAALPERDFTLEAVQDYILHHAVRPETLEKYLFFSKGNYTRNLIFKNAVFECMTICWEVGQHSRIHNHRDQNC